MPKHSIQLTIPEPCTQDWNDMTPVVGGRHCSSCNKTVVDFTAMSDAGIISFFYNRSAGICGQFRDDQLLRPLQPEIPAAKFPRLPRIAASALIMLALHSDVSAQRKRSDSISTEMRAAPNSATSGTVPDVTINGDVHDERGQPLPNAYVELVHEGIVIGREMSDFDGLFAFRALPAMERGSICRITVRYQQRDTAQDVVIANKIPVTRLVIRSAAPSQQVRVRRGEVLPLIDQIPAKQEKKPSRR